MLTILRDAILSLDMQCIDNNVEPDVSCFKSSISDYISIDSNKIIDLKVDPASIALYRQNGDIFVNYSLGWVPTIQGKIALLSIKDDLSLTVEQCNDLGYMTTYSKLNINKLDIRRIKLCTYRLNGTLIGCNCNPNPENDTMPNQFQIWGATELLKFVYGQISICDSERECFFSKY